MYWFMCVLLHNGKKCVLSLYVVHGVIKSSPNSDLYSINLTADYYIIAYFDPKNTVIIAQNYCDAGNTNEDKYNIKESRKRKAKGRVWITCCPRYV